MALTAPEVALIASGVSTPLIGGITYLFKELLKAEREKCLIYKDLFDKKAAENEKLTGTLDKLSDNIGETAATTTRVMEVLTTLAAELREANHERAPRSNPRRS